ncbi:hypothetical protein [Paraburkholderia sp. GAS32]|uniref:hypothetical protein n=1 Tax=Paraburkholderia sp. GAS32 TaxID=3035129 RepID=UPI003D25E25D
MKWFVEIVEYATDKVEKRIECASEHLVEKTDSGANRNLDHEHFFTRVVSE